MIEGTLENLTPEGGFSGWLRDSDSDGPAIVEIRQAGQALAQAVAGDFRPDLLAGGHGHGHYGFTALLRAPLPPGPALFDLFLPRHGQGIRVRLSVPVLQPVAPARVEDLLQPRAIWRVADALPHLSCLKLEEARTAMGTPRFVDVSFRFALRRWPGPDEAAVYIRALQIEGLTPEGLLTELLTGRERADLDTALASPWDAEFPYTGPLTRSRAA